MATRTTSTLIAASKAAHAAAATAAFEATMAAYAAAQYDLDAADQHAARASAAATAANEAVYRCDRRITSKAGWVLRDAARAAADQARESAVEAVGHASRPRIARL